MSDQVARTRDPLAAGPRRGSHWDLPVENGKLVLRPYPFQRFVHRAALDDLRAWFDVGNFRGGAILVTGCRGSGKSSAVNRALYDASVLARGLPASIRRTLPTAAPGAPLQLLAPVTYYREFATLIAAAKLKLDVPRPTEERAFGWTPTLVVEVPVNLARPLSGDALVRRVVRSLYAGLVRAGVAGFAPDLVASAREAYVRTVATVKDLSQERLKESFTNNYKVSLNDKNGMAVEAGIAAAREIELARMITLEFPVSTREELDEHLLRLLEDLDGTLFTRIEGLAQQLNRAADWAKLLVKRARAAASDAWFGTNGIAVHVVFVFDELDKLETDAAAPTHGDAATQQAGGTGHTSGTGQTGGAGQTGAAHPEPRAVDLVNNVETLANAIKPILAGGRASFVVVAGPGAAAEWVRAQSNPNGALPSVFSRHVHFGVMSLAEAWGMLQLVYPDATPLPLAPGASPGAQSLYEQNLAQGELVAAWLLLVSRGSFTRIVGILRELRGVCSTYPELLRHVRDRGISDHGQPLARALVALFVDRLFFRQRTRERQVPPGGWASAYMHPVHHDSLYQAFLTFAAEPITDKAALQGQAQQIWDEVWDAGTSPVPLQELVEAVASVRWTFGDVSTLRDLPDSPTLGNVFAQAGAQAVADLQVYRVEAMRLA